MVLLSSRLVTSSRIRSRKCLRIQAMTKRLGANNLSVFKSCSTCSGKIQVLSCCSLISPSRQEMHCCQIKFKIIPSRNPNVCAVRTIWASASDYAAASGKPVKPSVFAVVLPALRAMPEQRPASDNIILIHSPSKEGPRKKAELLSAIYAAPGMIRSKENKARAKKHRSSP